MLETHIYQRSSINEGSGCDSLSKLARLVKPNSRVLDIGCNYGSLGQYLIDNKKCIVDGVDFNEAAIEIAKKSLRKAYVCDLEKQNINDILSDKYDFIICADVLEHLRNPGKTLLEIQDLLADSGKLLISIPNVAYIGVILDLMGGNFRYSDEGILDNTHLRFFTQTSILKYLYDHNFKAKVLDAVIVPLDQSEFSPYINSSIFKNLFEEISKITNPLIYQFIIEASKKDDNENDFDPKVQFYDDSIVIYDEFINKYAGKIYWRKSGDDFSESNSDYFYIPLGKESHVITYELMSDVCSLRFHPLAKPGFIHFKSLVIRDKDTLNILWAWDKSAKTLAKFAHTSLFITKNDDGEVIITTLYEDSHIIFDLDKIFVNNDGPKNNFIVELEVSWPKSPDYFFVKDSLKDYDNLIKSLSSQINEANSDKHKLNLEIVNLNNEINIRNEKINEITKTLENTYFEVNRLNKNIEERYQELGSLHGELTNKNVMYEALLQDYKINLSNLKSQIDEKSKHINELNHEIELLHQNINNIVNSKSWVVTKPLRFILRNLKKSVSAQDAAALVVEPQILDNEALDSHNQGIADESDSALSNTYYDYLFKSNNNSDLDYVDYEGKPAITPKLKAIAFYLPQFHPIPENDEWWGRGFTEWTNVTKAIPQFYGHYQPRLPGELGFYDLRLPEIMARQIELAKNYGLYGFCFHYYWFNGKKLLEKPVEDFLKNKDLDFKFCLNWANENWSRRWDGKEGDVLIGQKHSEADDIDFIKEMCKYFVDERYIRIDGKPLLMIYRPSQFPNASETVNRWRQYCRQSGIGEIYLMSTHSHDSVNPESFGFDACTEFAPNNMKIDLYNLGDKIHKVSDSFEGSIFDYLGGIKECDEFIKPDYVKYRSVCPAWDNEARKPGKGVILYNSTPNNYEIWLNKICEYTDKTFTNENNKIIFINAWNEWAEGAVLEPDRKYGYAYLDKTYKILSKYI